MVSKGEPVPSISLIPQLYFKRCAPTEPGATAEETVLVLKVDKVEVCSGGQSMVIGIMGP